MAQIKHFSFKSDFDGESRYSENFRNGQEQPPEVFYKKLFLKFLQFHRKIPVLESSFDKVAGLKAYNFIKKGLEHRFFPVNIAKFLREPFWKTSANGCFWMYLYLWYDTKMKFLINGFLSERDQIRSFLQIWSHFLRSVIFSFLLKP